VRPWTSIIKPASDGLAKFGSEFAAPDLTPQAQSRSSRKWRLTRNAILAHFIDASARKSIHFLQVADRTGRPESVTAPVGDRASRRYPQNVGRVLIGAVVVAIVAAILFYFYSQNCHAKSAAQAQQISEMSNRLNQLQQDNDQLKGELAKVQDEENKLNAQNTELLKAIATFKATGKMPEVPAYPPK
jgi:C4-dicarboxylate-specific signal transduction histidine kinase